jgi:hypothetical protein
MQCLWVRLRRGLRRPAAWRHKLIVLEPLLERGASSDDVLLVAGLDPGTGARACGRHVLRHRTESLAEPVALAHVSEEMDARDVLHDVDARSRSSTITRPGRSQRDSTT